ncbi:MAG TPA: hypothetical protein VMU51_38595 [Mycobacteriales bacterium]|nr:hypothetical protein [Mycobacteriales bacterium]
MTGYGWTGAAIVAAWLVVLAPAARWALRAAAARVRAARIGEAEIRAAYGPGTGDLLAVEAGGVDVATVVMFQPALPAGAVAQVLPVPAAACEPVGAGALRLALWRATERMRWDVMVAGHEAQMRAYAAGSGGPR